MPWPSCNIGLDPFRAFQQRMVRRMHRIHGNPGLEKATAAAQRKRLERKRAEAEAKHQAQLAGQLETMLAQLKRTR